MKVTVKKTISLGILDSVDKNYCMKVRMNEGDEWEVSDGYCKIEGTKVCERDCFMVRLSDKAVEEIFGGEEDES